MKKIILIALGITLLSGCELTYNEVKSLPKKEIPSNKSADDVLRCFNNTFSGMVMGDIQTNYYPESKSTEIVMGIWQGGSFRTHHILSVKAESNQKSIINLQSGDSYYGPMPNDKMISLINSCK